jgi:hypothetical protein
MAGITERQFDLLLLELSKVRKAAERIDKKLKNAQVAKREKAQKADKS